MLFITSFKKFLFIHFFVWIWVINTIWYPFLSAWRTPFSTSWVLAGSSKLLIWVCLNFSFIFEGSLWDIKFLVEKKFLVDSFVFHTLNIPFYCLPAFIVSDEKLVMTLMFHCTWWWFSFDALKIFRCLFLTVCILCLGVDLCSYPSWVGWPTCLCRLMFSIKFSKFSDIIFSNFFLTFSFLFHYMYVGLLSHKCLRLHSLLFHSHASCSSVDNLCCSLFKFHCFFFPAILNLLFSPPSEFFKYCLFLHF